jgi:general stress protein 26
MDDLKRFVRGIFVCAALSLGAGAFGQASPSPTPDRAAIVKAAREVMLKARYCALITIGPGGQPQARPVDPFAPEEDLTVWIATNPVTRKVKEIRDDARVTLMYLDPAGDGYVTLIGKATLVGDPAEKARLWKDDWLAFYKDKNRGDDYQLIRVVPSRVEIVSGAHGLANDPQSWRPVSVDLP